MHVAECMVVLERVHVSEIGCNVAHSVKLDAEVELRRESAPLRQKSRQI